MQHLVAVGAVTTVEIARLAGANTAMSAPGGGGSAPAAGSGAVVGRAGQEHHAISRRIHKALEDHPILRGKYTYRDPRLVTRGADATAHRGYQQWHRDLDAEVVAWVRKERTATPAQFERWLRWRYSQPDLAARFPGGL